MKIFLSVLLLSFFSNAADCAEHYLSFIIPCYNCDQWINQAVTSIYEQKNLQCPFEIICTDDGSSDNTRLILENLAQDHPEIHIYWHSKNLGGASARNTCVQHCQGDIIFCLDADNVLVPNSVQILIDHMDQTGCDIVAFGGPKYFVDDFHETQQVTYHTPTQSYTLYDILNNATTPPCSGNYLYTKKSFELAGGYPPQWCIDTITFGFNQVLNGCKMSYVPDTYYWHRQGIESYYIRENKVGRINLHFFEFWLSHRDIFTNSTVNLIQEHYERAKRGENFLDFIFFLSNHLLQLKTP